jgi:uncharacterized protein (DUF1810 family)
MMSAMPSDDFDLARFVAAQAQDHAVALRELRAGAKRSHWMWYVFPQVAGLGTSAMAERYAIRSRREAAAYLGHPVLGPRLRTCTEALLQLSGRSARQVMGSPDDLKLRSSLTLFAALSPAGSVFHQALDRYFDGAQDQRTLDYLAAHD